MHQWPDRQVDPEAYVAVRNVDLADVLLDVIKALGLGVQTLVADGYDAASDGVMSRQLLALAESLLRVGKVFLTDIQVAELLQERTEAHDAIVEATTDGLMAEVEDFLS